MIPYDQMDFPSKLAYKASLEAYKYNAEINEPYRSYRCDPSLRSNITITDLNKHVFQYYSHLSNDQVGVWQSGSCIVMGFRGTDTSDPLRYLNFVPDNYNELIQDTYNNITGPDSPVMSDSIFLLRPTPKRTVDFNTLPVTNTTCKCINVFCNTNNDVTKENILTRTNANICGITPQIRLIAPISNDKKKSDLGFGELRGGHLDCKDFEGGGGRANEYSDCQADIAIANAFGLFSKDLSALKFDIKHKWAKISTKKVIEFFSKLTIDIKPLTIIFTGHSLGGSLAANAYLNTLVEYPDVKSFYVGFNAAILGNFNDAARRAMRNNFEGTNVHYRNRHDGVSNGLTYALKAKAFGQSGGPRLFSPLSTFGLFKTVTFQKVNDTETTEYSTFDTLTHGLFTMEKCKVNIQELDKLRNFTFKTNKQLRELAKKR